MMDNEAYSSKVYGDVKKYIEELGSREKGDWS